ncbi:MAG: hypothetical protein IPL35_00275 [Sphingobacteriales bacterium]|nr:hypothetical protein [Sphingobacteriales bacterium]
MSAAEQQPHHIYTQEALALYKSKMTENSLLIFNVIDFVDTSKSKILERIGDGLVVNGFQTHLVHDFYDANLLKEKKRIEAFAHEWIIVALNGVPNEFSVSIDEMNPCCKSSVFNQAMKQNFMAFSYQKPAVSTAPFIDDCPTMEQLSYERIHLLRTQFLTQ